MLFTLNLVLSCASHCLLHPNTRRTIVKCLGRQHIEDAVLNQLIRRGDCREAHVFIQGDFEKELRKLPKPSNSLVITFDKQTNFLNPNLSDVFIPEIFFAQVIDFHINFHNPFPYAFVYTVVDTVNVQPLKKILANYLKREYYKVE